MLDVQILLSPVDLYTSQSLLEINTLSERNLNNPDRYLFLPLRSGAITIVVIRLACEALGLLQGRGNYALAEMQEPGSVVSRS